MLWLLGDRWWLATVFLFGPRWPLLLPAFPLLIAALAVRPRAAIPTTFAALIILGPVTGYNFGWRGLLASGGPRELRLITFNVEAIQNTRIASVPLALSGYGADVVTFQECNARLTAPELWPAGWSTRIEGDICLASRFPILSARVEDRIRTGTQGGTGTVVIFRLAAPPDSFDVAVVHLETPRKGLEPLRYGGSVGSLKLNILVRDAGSSRSSRWIAEQSPDAIITGDFNLPVESRIFRTHWSRCPDAFTTAGRGFGWTRVLKRFSARIDHVLTCGSWRAQHAEVGPDLGSDHLPLIVDLARRR